MFPYTKEYAELCYRSGMSLMRLGEGDLTMSKHTDVEIVSDKVVVVTSKKSRYNETLVRPHTVGLPYIEALMPPVPGEDPVEPAELTAGYCCIDALLATYPDKKNDQKPAVVGGTEKLSRFDLAEKIKESMYHDTDVVLTGGEQQRLMSLMEQKWSTDIYGQCHKIVHRNEPDGPNSDDK